MTDKEQIAKMTDAHAALVMVEAELRRDGRANAADGLAYADLLVLAARNHIVARLHPLIG